MMVQQTKEKKGTTRSSEYPNTKKVAPEKVSSFKNMSSIANWNLPSNLLRVCRFYFF